MKWSILSAARRVRNIICRDSVEGLLVLLDFVGDSGEMFSGISRPVLHGLLVFVNRYVGMSWVYCV